MSFEEEFNKVDKKSKEVSKTAESILKVLDKKGYDDAIVILRKDQAVGAASSNLDDEFTPLMLSFLYSKMNALNKARFAVKILGITEEELVNSMLEDEEDED
ncbi:hypothetical protein AB0Y06_02650 [Ligilactobacillus salivarius]|uniref:hypothetical protein n=1 Tax=Ligilactobacillus salivarius TaxID=1624 RepID=UPI003F266CB6